MKRFFTLICIFSWALTASAQGISVASFRALPYDGTASSINGKRTDQNGEVAALIKVVTTQTDFTFEGGRLGIVDTKQEKGEIWVWVPRASRKITIKHADLGVLRDYMFPVEIEAERTYEMVLTTDEIQTIVKKKVTQQYLAFKITPPNAILEVNNELWNVDDNGSAVKFVDFGTYDYRVRASDYFPEAGKVTVNDPKNTQMVEVVLKPNFATVTLTVDAPAEIWVNNEKKGIRSWTGPLGKGIYKIECKQANHETSTISQEITPEMSGQTIKLAAPRPIYGSLNVESNPNFAKLYIDGQAMGETPKFISEILVGQHEIRLTKEGYADFIQTVTVNQNQREQVVGTLNLSEQANTKPSVDIPKVPIQYNDNKSNDISSKISSLFLGSQKKHDNFGGFHIGLGAVVTSIDLETWGGFRTELYYANYKYFPFDVNCDLVVIDGIPAADLGLGSAFVFSDKLSFNYGFGYRIGEEASAANYKLGLTWMFDNPGWGGLSYGMERPFDGVSYNTLHKVTYIFGKKPSIYTTAVVALLMGLAVAASY